MGSATQDGPVNILCLKWGSRYPAYFANALYQGVRRFLRRPFRFVCVTENTLGLDRGIETFPIPENPGMAIAWPNVFLKLLVTADGFAGLQGPTLFCDLDVVLTGELDCFFDFHPGKPCIIHNWVEMRKQIFRSRPAIGNSSVFRFEAGQSQYICDTFLREQDQAVNPARFRTEQAFLTYAMREWYWWPETWVRSFKRHSLRPFPLNLCSTPRLPHDTRILVFHGHPDPDEALRGYRGRRPHQHALPAPWIADYWRTS